VNKIKVNVLPMKFNSRFFVLFLSTDKEFKDNEGLEDDWVWQI